MLRVLYQYSIMACKSFVILVILTVFYSEDTGAFLQKEVRDIFNNGILNINPFRCVLRKNSVCPHPDVQFRMYTPKNHRGVPVNVRNPFSLALAGFDKHLETVFIIHGFNGTERDRHIMYLRDAFVHRDFNVITVDWRQLTYYPCYLTALANTQLAAQCSAQIYAFLTHQGGIREKMTCVGHSLGAHICGMVSNHLTTKQYKIIGLDPAKPLIEGKKSKTFRLTRDDANIVQVLHTNSGFLGQTENSGYLNYCVNGGKYQPFCKGHPIKRSRCSHFLSICYLANALFKHKKFLGVPCPNGCVGLSGPKRLPLTVRNPLDFPSLLKYYKIGTDAPDDLFGTYCLDMEFAKHCPFNDVR